MYETHQIAESMQNIVPGKKHRDRGSGSTSPGSCSTWPKSS